MLGNDENWVICERETSRWKKRRRRDVALLFLAFVSLEFFRSKKILIKSDFLFGLAHLKCLGWAKPRPGPEGKSLIWCPKNYQIVFYDSRIFFAFFAFTQVQREGDGEGEEACKLIVILCCLERELNRENMAKRELSSTLKNLKVIQTFCCFFH